MTDFPYFWTLYLFIAIVVAAPILWKRARFRRMSRKAVAWQSMTAQIQIIEVENVGRDTGISVTLGYSYFLDEYYSGEHVMTFPTDDWAYDFARLIREAKVMARFDPRNPSQSVLDEQNVLSIFAEAKQRELQDDAKASPELQFELAEYETPPSQSQ